MTAHDAREHVKQIVVVEGLHDKQAVDRAVRADVWVVGGERLAEKLLSELQRAAAKRGVIVLTDPDGPGERIRRRITDTVADCQHAFVKREDARSPNGKRVGIEFATPAAIANALACARVDKSFETNLDQTEGFEFTIRDLEMVNLANHPQAAWRRTKVGEHLRIGYANAKSFLHKLNALGVTWEEWEEALLQSFPDESRVHGTEKGSGKNRTTN